MGDTSRSQTISTRLQQIAKQAEDYPQMVFTTLAHHIDVDLIRSSKVAASAGSVRLSF